MRSILRSFLLVQAFWFLTGCGTDGSVNSNIEVVIPKLGAIIADPITVSPGDTSLVSLQIVDGSIDTLTASYSATGGSISGEGGQAVFVAGTSEGVARIAVTVSGQSGQFTSGSATVNITNDPPLVSVAAQTLDATTAGAQCLVFTGLPKEDLILRDVVLRNPNGLDITLTGELVTGLTGRLLPAWQAFALQGSGQCFTQLSGNYTFTLTLQRSDNEPPFQFAATHVEP